jgi:hypothetical protein
MMYPEDEAIAKKECDEMMHRRRRGDNFRRAILDGDASCGFRGETPGACD